MAVSELCPCAAKITLPPPLCAGAASVAITTCCYSQEAEVKSAGGEEHSCANVAALG